MPKSAGESSEAAIDVCRRRILNTTGSLALALGAPWLTACSRKESGSAAAVPPSEWTSADAPPKRVALVWEGTAFIAPPPQVLAEQRRRGWIEGKNIVFDRRAFKTADELPALMSEIVALKPDAIVVYTTAAALAVKKATTTIPVVFNVGADPVRNGIVPSLAHPGANMTGFYWGVNDEKRLQLVRDLVPSARLVAYMNAVDAQLTQRAADMGLRLRSVDAANEQDLGRFLADLPSAHCDAIVISQQNWIGRDYILRRMADAFIHMRIPSMGAERAFVAAGGLAAYQPTVSIERGVGKLDQILRGAKPSDIPVEMPTHYRLIINARTAKAIGLAIPSFMLQIADEVIA